METKIKRINIASAVIVLLLAVGFLIGNAQGIFTSDSSHHSDITTGTINHEIITAGEPGKRVISVENTGTVPSKVRMLITETLSSDNYSDKLQNTTLNVSTNDDWKVEVINGFEYIVYDKELKQGEKTSSVDVFYDEANSTYSIKLQAAQYSNDKYLEVWQ